MRHMGKAWKSTIRPIITLPFALALACLVGFVVQHFFSDRAPMNALESKVMALVYAPERWHGKDERFFLDELGPARFQTRPGDERDLIFCYTSKDRPCI